MATDSIAIIKAVFPANAQKYGLRDTEIQADISSGFISKYTNRQDCAQAGGQEYSAIRSGQSSGLGLLAAGDWKVKLSSVISNALNLVPFVGPALSQIWQTVNPFAHHAAAVAREQSTLCSLIPQVNQTLAATDTAVRSGQLSVVDADAQLESMLQGFESSTSGIVKDSGDQCNAACVMRAEVAAEVAVHEQGYHNSPIYYLKKYWWVGAIALGLYLILGRR